jgi:glycosyltransferase involved in cell wall biosynthesis
MPPTERPPAAPLLSIVLPSYNAAGFLRTSLSMLCAQRERWPASEIVVVDDGSRDDTARVAAGFLDAGVACLRLPRNAGKGAAVRAGMLQARGAYRIFMDCDVPYDLQAVDTMLRYLDVKEFDVVIGSRDLPGSHFVVPLSGPRRIASAIFTSFVSRFAVTGISDTQCGLKGFRAAAAERLFRLSVVDGFIFDVEVLYLAYKLNLDVKRIPVRQVRNEASTISLPWHSAGMLLDLLGIPLRFYRGGYDLG